MIGTPADNCLGDEVLNRLTFQRSNGTLRIASRVHNEHGIRFLLRIRERAFAIHIMRNSGAELILVVQAVIPIVYQVADRVRHRLVFGEVRPALMTDAALLPDAAVVVPDAIPPVAIGSS